MLNIVQVKHFGYDQKRYTFKVPFGINLVKGEMVMVKNRAGETQAICVTDSKTVDDVVLDMIMEGKDVTGKVIGRYNFEEITWKDEGEK